MQFKAILAHRRNKCGQYAATLPLFSLVCVANGSQDYQLPKYIILKVVVIKILDI